MTVVKRMVARCECQIEIRGKKNCFASSKPNIKPAAQLATKTNRNHKFVKASGFCTLATPTQETSIMPLTLTPCNRVNYEMNQTECLPWRFRIVHLSLSGPHEMVRHGAIRQATARGQAVRLFCTEKSA